MCVSESIVELNREFVELYKDNNKKAVIVFIFSIKLSIFIELDKKYATVSINNLIL